MEFSFTRILDAINYAISILILARCLIDMITSSYDGRSNKNYLGSFIYDVTEPIIKPFRKLLPTSVMIDSSPIVALASLEIIFSIVIMTLRTWGIS